MGIAYEMKGQAQKFTHREMVAPLWKMVVSLWISKVCGFRTERENRVIDRQPLDAKLYYCLVGLETGKDSLRCKHTVCHNYKHHQSLARRGREGE